MRNLAAALAAFVLLCGGSAGAATRGGTFVFSPIADCIFLDPVFTQQNPDIWVSLNIYDTLLHPSSDAKSLEPGLAKSWEVAPDAMSVTLTMRPGIQFADGSPIGVSDVKFSLDRARDKASGEFNFLLESI